MKRLAIKATLAVIVLAIMAACLSSWIGGGSTYRREDPFAQQRASAAFKRGQWFATAATVAAVALFGALGLMAVGVAAAMVRLISRKAGEVQHKDGVFPVQRGHMFAWLRGPRLVTYYHDPNKAAGPATVYAAVGAGDQLDVKQVTIDEVSPAQERITARSQAAQAVAALPRELRSLGGGQGRKARSEQQEALPAPEMFRFPREVALGNLLTEPPALDRLVMGLAMDRETGQQEVVRENLGRLVHGAVGGTSGWGKSVFLRALGYQMAMSRQECELAMIDLEGATFAPFASCGRLLYPVADNEVDARAIMDALLSEMDRRKELYARFPGVDSLEAYNRQAGEPLSPVVCLVDEATSLLGDKAVHGATRELAMRARKYGVWLWLGGTDFKASSLDTAIRNNLSTRVQFRAMSKSQSRVLLGQPGAEELDAPGRAYVILPGRDMLEIQAPYVSHRQILADVSNGGPRHNMPALVENRPAGVSGVDEEKAALIQELKEAGESDTAIARHVFGYGNTFYIEKVRTVLRQQQQ